MRGVVLVLALLGACSPYDDLRLLEVEEVQPQEIEPGTTLRIVGAGFPLGRTPELRLAGTVHRPGQAPQDVEVTFEGLVRSDELIEAPVGTDLIGALGGRATFDGQLRVGFAASLGDRDVFAEEPLRVDFLPDTATELRADGLGELRDEGVAEAFGLELSAEELGTPGVRVVEVVPGSVASEQGVAPGDTVVALDGVRIYSRRDFIPDPTRLQSTVLMAREGLPGRHPLRWPHDATEAPFERGALAVFLLIGLMLGWCSPAALLVRRPPSELAVRVWLGRAALCLGFSALLLHVPAMQWTTMWMLTLATFAALFTLATRDRTGTWSFATAMGATLAVMLLCRTASLSTLIDAQAPNVLRWHLFQSPASWAAFFVYLHALGVVAVRSRPSATLYAAPAAVLGATLFLGGWPLASPWAGMLMLALKASALLVLAHVIVIRPKHAASLAVGALILAAIDPWVDLGALFPPWSALAIGITFALGVRAALPARPRAAAPLPA